MNDRHATFLICDDVLLGLTGKFYLNGIYTTDLVIAAEESQLPQLVVVVMADSPIDRPFRSFVINVQLPGEAEPRIFDAMNVIRSTPPSAAPPGRTIQRVRVPFLLQRPKLRQGPIEVSILHDEGTTSAGRQWIQSLAGSGNATPQMKH